MTDDTPTVLVLGRIMSWVERRLEDAYRVVKADWDTLDATLAEHAPRIRALATFGHVPVDAALLDRLPALETVANYGVGYDTVDAQAAAARGVIVTHTPDVLTDEVADLTMGLLLATLRALPKADAFLRAGDWADGPFPLSPLTLRGRRVGMLGYGRIGQAVARRLEGFDVPIAYHARSRRETPHAYHATPLDLAEAVDTLICSLPGGDGTRHVIDGALLDALGPDGVVVNIGRGSSLDEATLANALKGGRIAAAGLDVFEDEPRVNAGLLEAPNTVLLPHIGSATRATRQAMGQRLLDNLSGWFKDQCPPSPVPETPLPDGPRGAA